VRGVIKKNNEQKTISTVVGGPDLRGFSGVLFGTLLCWTAHEEQNATPEKDTAIQRGAFQTGTVTSKRN